MRERIKSFLFLAILLGLLLMAASGCKSNKNDASSNPRADLDNHKRVLQRETGIIRDAAKSGDGDRVAKMASAGETIAAEIPVVDRIAEGISKTDKKLADSEKRNDASKAPYYRNLDYASFVSGVLLALGVATFVMSIINPTLGLMGKSIGVGLSVLGGVGVIVFRSLRSIGPAEAFFGWSMAAIGVASVAYLVFVALRSRNKIQVEQKATKELVRTVEAVKSHLSEPSKSVLFGEGGTVETIQSDTTTALVREAGK